MRAIKFAAGVGKELAIGSDDLDFVISAPRLHTAARSSPVRSEQQQADPREQHRHVRQDRGKEAERYQTSQGADRQTDLYEGADRQTDLYH